MSASEVTLCCEALREFVPGSMDPASSQQLRVKALQFCDDFKEKSPLCVPCGLMLADNTEAAAVRHFGFQILEHVVRCRWPVMPPEEREYLKKRFTCLISAETASILEGEPYIRDAAARVMVEMIKRDWPACWPMMLSDLEGLSQKGALQAELVLLILLRLAEDVNTFQKRTLIRGASLRGAMMENMHIILRMVKHLLRHYVSEYKHLETDPAQETQVQTSCRVAAAALNTLAGYVKLVGMRHIKEKNYMFVKMLWNFLDEPKLQLEASECLLATIDRIGICDLFVDLPVQHLSPAQTADREPLTDRRYFFLKRQCDLLCVVIKQLCYKRNSKAFVKIHSKFGTYLDILFDFTTHPSQFLSSLTQSTWKRLFEHSLSSRNPSVLAMLPKYLRAARRNLVKVGFPSKKNSPSCEYSRLEFVCDDDFCEFLTAFRDEQRMVIEAACRIDQRTCYQIVVECLTYQLSSSVDAGPMNAVTADRLCHASTESFQQWEATVFFVKVITETLFKILKTEKIPVNYLIELLQRVMNFKTEDPLILACVQTNISKLFPLLNYRKECPSQITFKVLHMIEEMKDAKAQSLKSVRRSVCSSLIQLCRDNAQNLLCDFEVLNDKVMQLLGNEKLMQMEKGTLMQAMVIIINQFKNYRRQKALLEKLMASACLTQEMKSAFSQPEAFIQYVGANLPITDKVRESQTGRNRSKIMHCVSTILGVLKWSRWPPDLEEAKAGGFVTGFMHSGRPIYRNPCIEQVQKLFTEVFSLIRTQHDLYLPSVIGEHSALFAKSLDLLEVENTSPLDLPQPLLDIYDPPEYNTELERMQAFLCTLYETCFSILGHAGSSMNYDFYTRKGFYFQLSQCVFPVQKMLPLYRLLSMLRAFLKPLVHCCPPEYYETLLRPIIKQFLDCCNLKLSFEWNIINRGNEANKESTVVENPESQKTPENQVKLLTGEAMEFLFACCVPNDDTSVTAASNDACCVSNGAADNMVCTAESDDDASVCNEDAGVVAAVSDGDCRVPVENEDPSAVLAVESDDGEMAAEVPLLPQPASTELSELGEVTELTTLGMCLLKEKACCSSLLRTAFSSLLWNDSLTCYKTVMCLCWPLLKQTISYLLSVHDMVHVFKVVLSGIQKHKDDRFSSDALVNLAFHIYKSLRPRKEFRKVMNLVSLTKDFYVEKFDFRVFSYKIQKQNKMLKDDLKHLIKACTKNPSGNTSQYECIRIPAPRFRKRKRPTIPVQKPNNLPPPSKKFFLPTMYSPLMFAKDDRFSKDEYFFWA